MLTVNGPGGSRVIAFAFSLGLGLGLFCLAESSRFIMTWPSQHKVQNCSSEMTNTLDVAQILYLLISNWGKTSGVCPCQCL
jgi:hypothetical protein